MTNEILVKRLNSLRNSKSDGKVKNLYSLLYYNEIWYLAYQNIYSNKGAFTKGSDDSDTLDNFDKERISKIIASLKDMSYQCKPARRINIPKANGSTRPLSIPCGTDKLVQEACRIILEAIYEPKFSDSSHGFRPGRSCHTALQKVSTWTSTKWWIEFDIKGCFDNIDHDILISLLEIKIYDQRFLELIRKFLKAGYIDNFQYHKTYSGTPQGGIISPILANIYLDKLDKFIDNECFKTNDNTIKNAISQEYTMLKSIMHEGSKRILKYKGKYENAVTFIKENIANKMFSKEINELFKECFELNTNKEYPTLQTRCIKIQKIAGLDRYKLYDAFKVFEYEEKLNRAKSEVEEAANKRKNVRATEFNPEFERLHYVRYADDFILGYIGNKENAEKIFSKIKQFIETNLNLNISDEKSKIKYGIEGIIYLGYKVEMSKYDGSKTTRRYEDGKEVKMLRSIGTPVFKVPVENAIKFVSKNKYGSYTENKSESKTVLQNFDEIEIIKQYNSELRGLIQYYKHAVNGKHIIGKVQWLWQYSLAKTLAAKHKCSTAQLFKKKIIKVKVDRLNKFKTWYIEKNEISIDVFNIRTVEHVKMFKSKYTTNTIDIEASWQINFRNSAVQKLIANECEICCITNKDVMIELHHPNQIKNIPKLIPYWDKVRRIRNRKTIAVCHDCHNKIHHPN